MPHQVHLKIFKSVLRDKAIKTKKPIARNYSNSTIYDGSDAEKALGSLNELAKRYVYKT